MALELGRVRLGRGLWGCRYLVVCVHFVAACLCGHGQAPAVTVQDLWWDASRLQKFTSEVHFSPVHFRSLLTFA